MHQFSDAHVHAYMYVYLHTVNAHVHVHIHVHVHVHVHSRCVQYMYMYVAAQLYCNVPYFLEWTPPSNKCRPRLNAGGIKDSIANKCRASIRRRVGPVPA